ncbi:MAG: DUF2330 domain-containing protein [Phycisphaeraceae bacterium]|nr:DUF2330 domain-containing protein [Phycisphaeraceae bacterium]
MVVIFRALICAALLVCSPVLGDGIVLPSHAAPAEIPEQSALINYDGKVETLAIETRFVAKGKDFAWVVPLPTKPEIRAGTAGMFPTLRAMFLPRMWEFEGAGFVIGLLGLFAFGIGLGMMGRGEIGARLAVWGSLAWILVNGCLLPTLGAAGGSRSTNRTAVLERSVIGDFDVAIVQSSDAGEMKGWLASNGFASTAQADRAIDDYVKRGWVFVASKLRRSFDEALVSAPTPLIFTFATGKPVYPMQLTGAGASDLLKLELFVFGDRFASASGCASLRRARVDSSRSPGRMNLQGTTEVLVSHRLIKELVSGATHATQLSRTLSPREMDRDIDIEFVDRSETGNSVASTVTVNQVALAVGLAGFSICGAGFMRRAAQIGPWPAGIRNFWFAVIAGCVASLATWAWIPAVKAAAATGLHDYMRRTQIEFACRAAIEGDGKRPAMTDAGASEVAQAVIEKVNPGIAKIEDSPGNFMVREVQGGLECVYYTWNGQEIAERIR